ncbi:MAG: HAD family hydrolase [Clostridia bacterium]|nr:HAD family hydrolase [Clostridia bacterium]
MIKAIAVDLDRTLLHTNKSLSAFTVSVLKRCQERGMKILLATARPERTAKNYCDAIGFDAMVFSNGARVICSDKVTEFGIPYESAESLLVALSSNPDTKITLETGDEAYSNKPIEDYYTVITDDLPSVAKAEGTLKILAHIENEDVIRTALPSDVYYTVSNGYLMQFMSKSATKWNGVKAMLDSVGCLPEETAYFGDDHDDIEPIRKCGMGVAVSNAIDEVKAVADHIAENNDADGVAEFIERNLLR